MGASFWPKGVEQSEQSRRVDEFSKAIYPIWRGREQKDFESEKSIPLDEDTKRGHVLYECQTLHKQDRAILASGIRPNMSAPVPDSFRKKQAASDNFSGWRGVE